MKIFTLLCGVCGKHRSGNDHIKCKAVLAVMPRKRCTHCHYEKLLSSFAPRYANPSKLSSWCRACMQSATQKRRYTKMYPNSPTVETHRALEKLQEARELAKVVAEDFL